MIDFGGNDLMPHFIYCSDFKCGEDVEKIFLTKMTKYGIQSSVLTMLTMQRMHLITKEKAKKTAEGKLKEQYNLLRWAHNGFSINDDLDSLFHKFNDEEEIKKEVVPSFCTPKLTKEELKLVEENNFDHMETYWFGQRADIDVEEMAKSDSKDKYIHSRCRRTMIQLTLETSLTSTDDEILAAETQTMKPDSRKRKLY